MELTARIRLMLRKPDIVCLNETFLDSSTKEVSLEGYSLVARRDRCDGRQCGGVAVFARSEVAERITLLEKSQQHERVWLMLHSNSCPYLLGVWYRPPDPGECYSINTVRNEWGRLSANAMGTLIVGDINVHHIRWLRHSSRNSSEGTALRHVCQDLGFQQLVKDPTRGDY